MLKTISLIAIVTALATPCAAQSVRVSVKGKTETVIRSEIRDAAYTVCRAAIRTDPAEFRGLSRCVRDTTRAAQADLDALPARSPERVALNASTGG